MLPLLRILVRARAFEQRCRALTTLPPLVSVRDALLHAPLDGNSISVHGWVRAARRQKHVSFVALNDGSSGTSLQVVWSEAEGGTAPIATPEACALLTTGASVRVEGALVASPKPGQRVELAASRVSVVGACPGASYPLQARASPTAELLRNVVHLRARGARGAAVLRLRATLSAALHAHLGGAGLVHVHAPVLTASDCEGAGELFAAVPASALATPVSAPTSQQQEQQQQHFFGRPVHLAVSAQLHLEAFASALSRVYAFGPTFRAENSNTPRHLAEFWMVEPEIAPAGLDDAILLCQGAVGAAAAAALSERMEDLVTLGGDSNNGSGGVVRSMAGGGGKRGAAAASVGGVGGGSGGVTSATLIRRLEDAATAGASRGRGFARMTYTEAVAVLQRGGVSNPPVWGAALTAEHERWLAETHVQGAVFVTDYPARVKPFYMRLNEHDLTAAAAIARTLGREASGCRTNDALLSSDAATAASSATVACFDLLVPGGMGELAGGSAREDRHDVLAAAMEHRGLLPPDVLLALGGADGGVSRPPADGADGSLAWYLDLRRFGSVPSAGWGLGFERLVAWAGGLDNVRDAIPVPRTRGVCRL